MADPAVHPIDLAALEDLKVMLPAALEKVVPNEGHAIMGQVTGYFARNRFHVTEIMLRVAVEELMHLLPDGTTRIGQILVVSKRDELGRQYYVFAR